MAGSYSAHSEMSPNSLPQKLQSRLFGFFSLKESRIYSLYSFHYTVPFSDPAHGAIEVIFNPPNLDPSSWSSALISAEQRAEALLASQHSILSSGEHHFETLFSDYGLQETKIDRISPRLKLRTLILNSEGNDEFIYDSPDLFPSFVLYVSVAHDLKVTEVNFDG